ncbi:hypothetical protein [Kocuria sp. SM24M-10]|uniref:hypothetical protein n=1 Tax=Kocuria sp. SM24M-10 TaxID=1660349 RepID=UPI00064AB0B4|nr:hypothetical protein [Kocuria sp. SM24M-10]KLU09141.1 hypothetical protein ABL57_13735 [Kocuria sp. SM24M-10]
MKTRRIAAVQAAAAVLTLAGCSPGSSDLYTGEQAEHDRLPATIDTADRAWDADSSRLLATHEGVEFYVVSGEEGDCLITLEP